MRGLCDNVGALAMHYISIQGYTGKLLILLDFMSPKAAEVFKKFGQNLLSSLLPPEQRNKHKKMWKKKITVESTLLSPIQVTFTTFDSPVCMLYLQSDPNLFHWLIVCVYSVYL